mgnify:CR=1 FL=1
MKKLNSIFLPNGSVIIDGLERLLIFNPEFVNICIEICKEGDKKPNIPEAFSLPYGNFTTPCAAREFITKKGRQAIQIMSGNTHELYFQSGCGDRSWNEWDERRPINGLFADAAATSNGGGCWTEVIIMPAGVEVITSFQQAYIDELK